MIQEEIDKVADQLSFAETPDVRERFLFRSGFKAGAKWRVSSVWHRTDNGQAPEEGRLCLLEVESYEEDGERYIDYVSSQWGHFGWTDDFLKIIKRRSEGRYKIIRWAYIEDLLPIKED